MKSSLTSNKKNLYLSGMALLVLMGCDKALLPVEFQYNSKDVELTIDSTEKGKVIWLDTIVIDNAGWDSARKANKVEPEDIQSVKIEAILIEADSGRNDLLADCGGYLYADALADKPIFYANYDDGVTQSDYITIYDVDLKAYLQKSKMFFHATAMAGTSTREKSKIKIKLRYRINAKI